MVVLKKKAGRRGRARERSRGVITAARKVESAKFGWKCPKGLKVGMREGGK